MKEVLIIVAEMSFCGTAAFLLYLLTVHFFCRQMSSVAKFSFLKAAVLLFVLPISKLLSPLLSLNERFTTAEEIKTSVPFDTVSPQSTTTNVPVPDFVPPVVSDTPIDASAPVVDEALAGSLDILAILAVIWITGILVIFLWRLLCRLHFEYNIRSVNSPAGEEVMSIYLRCCESMGVSHHIPVYICEKVYTPMIVGAVRPKILLPQKEISRKSLEFVFRHELTHYQRNDIFTKMLMSLVTMLHWFNPLVYVFDREFVSMLELSCDEMAGRTLDNEGRKDYCMAILETVPVRRTSRIGLIFGMSGKKKIKQRLDNILHFKKMRLSQKIFAAVAATMIIGVSCVLVAMFIPVDRTDNPSAHNISDDIIYPESTEDDTEDNGISGDTVLDNTHDDSNPNIITEQTQGTTDEQSKYLPDGYRLNQIMTGTGHLLDNGNGGEYHFNGEGDSTVLVSFALPEAWIFNGYSVADEGNTKVFEIGAVYPTEEFSLEKVGYFGVDMVFPTFTENNMGHTVTIYEQEVSGSGLYDYMDHSSTLLSTGEYETYDYIVSRNGWSMSVIFVVNENFSEDIVETILQSANITTVQQLPAELERDVTYLLDGFILTQDFLFTEPPASGSETAEYNGRTYYKITDEKYDTWDEWSGLFYSIYTDEFANNLLNNFNTVVNINGDTYSDGGSRGSDIDNNYDYTVISANDNRMIVDMTRGYHPTGDEDSFMVDRFIIVKTDSGWRIELRNGWNGWTE